ncbi:glycerol-3-phosphate acyltransferase PlsY [Candidatus Brocadiaceae bacterium]|nr:glycerol-3-phosphate acyltransferase PlsY [Candidatus Brocadiaceae bacterium]
MLAIPAIIVLSYLVGSIPFAILISRWVKGIDIREHGSGNAGGTNVFRVLGWKWGVTVIILDSLKGVVAVLLVTQIYYFSDLAAYNYTPWEDIYLIRIMAGITAIIGHVWSIFASFRGGKGIATALGMLLTITWVDILVAVGIFIIVVALSRYVSLGSIVAAVTVPATLIIRENIFKVDVPGYHTILPFLIGLFVLVVFTHRKNISRILSGKESKITLCKKEPQKA